MMGVLRPARPPPFACHTNRFRRREVPTLEVTLRVQPACQPARRIRRYGSLCTREVGISWPAAYCHNCRSVRLAASHVPPLFPHWLRVAFSDFQVGLHATLPPRPATRRRALRLT